jgi:hypothetical protein
LNGVAPIRLQNRVRASVVVVMSLSENACDEIDVADQPL